MLSGCLLVGCGESAAELYSIAQNAEKSGQSATEVITLYQKAADAGSHDAWLYLAQYYRSTGDYEKAVNSYLHIEETYPAIYAYNLGTMFLNGEGVPANEAKGIELLTRADREGEHLAFFEIGSYYYQKRDYVNAVTYLKKSVGYHDYQAYPVLARIYLDEKVSNADKTYAIDLLRQLVDGNKATPDVRLMLARSYIDGVGTEQSLLKAEVVLRGLEDNRDYADKARVLHDEIKLYSLDEGSRKLALKDLRDMVNEKADPDAALFLYEIYRNGKFGIEKSMKNALHYIRIAARGDSALAYLALASLYFDGVGIEQNFNESSRFIQKAYELEPDNPEVVYWYGRMYAEGIGVNRDDSKGFEYLSKAAELGHKDADYLRAVMINSGRSIVGSEQDAVKMFKKHADEGNAEAQYRYGLALYEGFAVGQNLEEAVAYLKKAASGGVTKAIFPLASACQELGLTEDAIVWYQRATTLPEPESRESWARLGEIYSAQKLLNESFRAYKKAYEAGHEKAGVNLGRLYYIAERYNEAMEIFLKYKDDPLSEVFIGLMYHYGRGVSQSDIKALEWYDKAIAKNNADAMFLEAVLIREGKDIPDSYLGIERNLLVNASCMRNEEATLYLATRYYSDDSQSAVGWLEYARKYSGSSRAESLLNREYNDYKPEDIARMFSRISSLCKR